MSQRLWYYYFLLYFSFIGKELVTDNPSRVWNFVKYTYQFTAMVGQITILPILLNSMHINSQNLFIEFVLLTKSTVGYVKSSPSCVYPVPIIVLFLPWIGNLAWAGPLLTVSTCPKSPGRPPKLLRSLKMKGWPKYELVLVYCSSWVEYRSRMIIFPSGTDVSKASICGSCQNWD